MLLPNNYNFQLTTQFYTLVLHPCGSSFKLPFSEASFHHQQAALTRFLVLYCLDGRPANVRASCA